MKRMTTTFSTLVLCLTILCAKAYPQQDCYSDPPQILEAVAHRTAQAIVFDLVENGHSPEIAAQAVNGEIQSLLLYAVGDAIAPDRTFEIYSLKNYEYIGETARTDKQIGASARSEGSTSAVEKPGFAQLLSIAIEHGAIEKQIDGNSLTLSTTPYAFIAWANKGDTAELYRRNEFFARLGLSASFNISNKDQPLNDVNTKQLTEWSVRVGLFGDRSTRSKKFQQWWQTNIRPKLNARNEVLLTGFGDLMNEKVDDAGTVKRFGKLGDELVTTLLKDISGDLNANQNRSSDEKISIITRRILCRLKEKIVGPVRSKQINLSPELKSKINEKVFPSLQAAHAALELAREDFNKFWDAFSQNPLTTFAYTNHRTSMGSDYSEFKLLHERANLHPMKLIANAWVSIYSNPDSRLNQQQVRDYGAALSFEGNLTSPFAAGTSDMSKLTYAFTGRYQRTKENEGIPGRKPDIAVAQFRLEIPIKGGVSVPLSVTYANATELIKEKHVRANFGLTLDLDKLFALTKRAANQ